MFLILLVWLRYKNISISHFKNCFYHPYIAFFDSLRCIKGLRPSFLRLCAFLCAFALLLDSRSTVNRLKSNKKVLKLTASRLFRWTKAAKSIFR